MHIDRRIKIQLIVFTVISLIALAVMAFGYVRVPAMLGFGHYTVVMELPRSGGLYASGNVTYRGTQVGKVESVDLQPDGRVQARLALDSQITIPSDVTAAVHSQSAIGEQYVALLPRGDNAVPLRDGDVIGLADTSVPPPVDELLDATNAGLQAIPHDSLRTAIDESYTAVGGLGPELARVVRGSSTLAIEAREHLDALTTLIDDSGPLLDAQIDTGADIRAWAAQLATITAELRDNDESVAGLLDRGGDAAAEARLLIDRLQPTIPMLLANLVSVGQVAVTYQSGVEQLLVLMPQGVAMAQGAVVANHNTKQDYKGSYLDFNLNINLPPPCTTGYLPASQRRPPAVTDAPDRPAGDVYCRIPQDAPQNVRGARNIPCTTRPGKRAPTVKMCESDEFYVPLNDGTNWKGDPNATLSGQDIPQLPPPSPPEGAPVVPMPASVVTQYDPATGSYLAPDGRVYTREDLSRDGAGDHTWQDMLLPPN